MNPDFEIEPSYQIYYSFTSSVDDDEPGLKYINDISIELAITDESGNRLKTIGKARLKIILLTSTEKQGVDPMYIFDSDGLLMEIGEQIYDFDEQAIKEDVLELIDFEISNDDIAVLTSFELLPEYRKMGLGRALIKDIYTRFQSSCDLIVLKVFPLQYNRRIADQEWQKEMEYDKLEKDFEMSEYKLKAFYKSVGFTYLEQHPDLMFLFTSQMNPILDNIDSFEDVF
ncbi:MAG: GNAT family N-acetyltransferase [Salinivirgaceae bacterium]|nr:GNAT family N-acetyltransferase [Salinivirgaceae bacterium]